MPRPPIDGCGLEAAVPEVAFEIVPLVQSAATRELLEPLLRSMAPMRCGSSRLTARGASTN